MADARETSGDAVVCHRHRVQLVDARPALVAEAHAAGLTVVPWKSRSTGRGGGGRDGDSDMRRFISTYGVDGLFTDNPDLFPRR